MKQLLIILTVLLSACISDTQQKTWGEHEKQEELKIVKKVYLEGERGTEFQFEVRLFTDGHDYMYNKAYNQFVCFHYVECRKCKNDSSCKNK